MSWGSGGLGPGRVWRGSGMRVGSGWLLEVWWLWLHGKPSHDHHNLSQAAQPPGLGELPA